MKIDLHTHTHYSSDAVLSPDDLVKVAKTKGLDGIAITDHNTTKAWKEVELAGKKHGLRIIPGEEIKVLHNGHKIGEVLGIFLNEEIEPGEFHEILEKIKSQDGILIVAHPFDIFRCPFKKLEEFKHDFDAVEVFNSRAIFNSFNQKALEFARENKMAMTAGSDAHCPYEIANAYTMADIADIENLKKAIEHRKTRFWGKKSNPMIHSVSTVAKIGLIGRK